MKQLISILAFIAIVQFARAQQDSVSHYLQQGEAAASRREFLPAYNAYKQATSFDDSNAEALKGMADMALELRYYVIARETYKKLLAISPKDTLLVRQLAELNFQTRQFQETVNLVQQARTMGSKASLDWLAARSYYEMEHYGSCLESIEKAWKKDSSIAQMPFIAARCYIEMNNYRRAAGCYEQAIRLDPTNNKWMYEAAMTYSARMKSEPFPGLKKRWRPDIRAAMISSKILPTRITETNSLIKVSPFTRKYCNANPRTWSCYSVWVNLITIPEMPTRPLKPGTKCSPLIRSKPVQCI